MRFVGIKVKSLKYWIWFKTSEVEETDTMFTGKNGWGKDNALTNISVLQSEIEARISSDNIQT
jgi:recombinational DNA repair ATPase RecF